MSRSRAFQAVLAAVLISSSIGCATTDPGDQPCMSDDDCPAGEVCDVAEQLCVRASIVTNNDEADAGNNGDDLPDAAVTNNGDSVPDSGNPQPDGGQPDTGPATCMPGCAADETCDNGQCVSACMPECVAPEVCTAQGCAIPDCSAVGDACDPTRPEQGGFGCAPTEDGGVCLPTCGAPFTASDCAAGEYCWTFDTLDVCIPSTCSTNADCPDDGTCVDVDNGFAACFESGTVPEGGACDPSKGGECVQDTLCRETGPASGVCSKTCDQFAADPGCGGAELCASQFTATTSLCTSDIDPRGSAPFYVCDNPGAACDHATQCFVGGTSNVCLKYCRAGQTDCAGIMDGGGNSAICNTYAFAGVREIGVCVSECQVNADCGSGAICLQNLCRASCDVAADCCDGASPCPYTCSADKLCE